MSCGDIFDGMQSDTSSDYFTDCLSDESDNRQKQNKTTDYEKQLIKQSERLTSLSDYQIVLESVVKQLTIERDEARNHSNYKQIQEENNNLKSTISRLTSERDASLKYISRIQLLHDSQMWNLEKDLMLSSDSNSEFIVNKKILFYRELLLAATESWEDVSCKLHEIIHCPSTIKLSSVYNQMKKAVWLLKTECDGISTRHQSDVLFDDDHDNEFTESVASTTCDNQSQQVNDPRLLRRDDSCNILEGKYSSATKQPFINSLQEELSYSDCSLQCVTGIGALRRDDSCVILEGKKPLDCTTQQEEMSHAEYDSQFTISNIQHENTPTVVQGDTKELIKKSNDDTRSKHNNDPHLSESALNVLNSDFYFDVINDATESSSTHYSIVCQSGTLATPEFRPVSGKINIAATPTVVDDKKTTANKPSDDECLDKDTLRDVKYRGVDNSKRIPTCGSYFRPVNLGITNHPKPLQSLPPVSILLSGDDINLKDFNEEYAPTALESCDGYSTEVTNEGTSPPTYHSDTQLIDMSIGSHFAL